LLYYDFPTARLQNIFVGREGVSDYTLRPMHTEVPTFQGNVRNSVKPDRW
jgi:hypothetical protein